MTDQTFALDVLPLAATRHLVLRGAFDLAAIEGFREAVRLLREEEPPALVVDLRELEFLDSSGLGELVRLQAAARADGFELTLVRGAGAVGMVFGLAGLEEHFAWVDAPEQLAAR